MILVINFSLKIRSNQNTVASDIFCYHFMYVVDMVPILECLEDNFGKVALFPKHKTKNSPRMITSMDQN